jgi:polyphosphate kinase 2 (PPK2 family)
MAASRWLEVGKDEQERRFSARIEDPLRQWKLSPMDIESYGRSYDYSRARDMMLEMTDSRHAPWYIVRSDNKRKARLIPPPYPLESRFLWTKAVSVVGAVFFSCPA